MLWVSSLTRGSVRTTVPTSIDRLIFEENNDPSSYLPKYLLVSKFHTHIWRIEGFKHTFYVIRDVAHRNFTAAFSRVAKEFWKTGELLAKLLGMAKVQSFSHLLMFVQLWIQKFHGIPMVRTFQSRRSRSKNKSTCWPVLWFSSNQKPGKSLSNFTFHEMDDVIWSDSNSRP